MYASNGFLYGWIHKLQKGRPIKDYKAKMNDDMQMYDELENVQDVCDPGQDELGLSDGEKADGESSDERILDGELMDQKILDGDIERRVDGLGDIGRRVDGLGDIGWS